VELVLTEVAAAPAAKSLEFPIAAGLNVEPPASWTSASPWAAPEVLRLLVSVARTEGISALPSTVAGASLSPDPGLSGCSSPDTPSCISTAFGPMRSGRAAAPALG